MLLSLMVLACVFMDGYIVLTDGDEKFPGDKFEDLGHRDRQNREGLQSTLTEEHRTELQKLRGEIKELKDAVTTREETGGLLAINLEQGGLGLPIWDGLQTQKPEQKLQR